MDEFAFKTATQEQKAAAFEWLREEALRRHNRRWFHAAVLMEELKRLNAARPEVGELEKAVIDAARGMLENVKYVRGLADDDEYKGPGNYLADAMDALDRARRSPLRRKEGE